MSNQCEGRPVIVLVSIGIHTVSPVIYTPHFFLEMFSLFMYWLLPHRFCLFGFNVACKHLRSYRDGALTNLLPHRNAMPQTRDMAPHPSQYTDTGPTCRCAIQWCGTSQLPTERGMKISRKYRTNRVLNPGPVMCEYITLSARQQRLPYRTAFNICGLSR